MSEFSFNDVFEVTKNHIFQKDDFIEKMNEKLEVVVKDKKTSKQLWNYYEGEIYEIKKIIKSLEKEDKLAHKDDISERISSLNEILTRFRKLKQNEKRRYEEIEKKEKEVKIIIDNHVSGMDKYVHSLLDYIKNSLEEEPIYNALRYLNNHLGEEIEFVKEMYSFYVKLAVNSKLKEKVFDIDNSDMLQIIKKYSEQEIDDVSILAHNIFMSMIERYGEPLKEGIMFVAYDMEKSVGRIEELKGKRFKPSERYSFLSEEYVLKENLLKDHALRETIGLPLNRDVIDNFVNILKNYCVRGVPSPQKIKDISETLLELYKETFEDIRKYNPSSVVELLAYFNKYWKKTDYKKKPVVLKSCIRFQFGEGVEISLNELASIYIRSSEIYKEIFHAYKQRGERPPYVKPSYLVFRASRDGVYKI